MTISIPWEKPRKAFRVQKLISVPKIHFGRKVKHKAEVNWDGENCCRANIIETLLAGSAWLKSRTQSFPLTVSKNCWWLTICCFETCFQQSIKVQLQISTIKPWKSKLRLTKKKNSHVNSWREFWRKTISGPKTRKFCPLREVLFCAFWVHVLSAPQHWKLSLGS